MTDSRRTSGPAALDPAAVPRPDAGPAARQTPAELELVARLRAGDEPAFAALIDRLHTPLLRLAQVFVSSREAAEEVVQDTWAAVLEGLDAFEGRSTIKTWVFRILTNRARTRGARDGRMVAFAPSGEPEPDGEATVEPGRFTADGSWVEPPRPWEHDSPETLLARKEALAALERALEGLPPSQRAVVTLRDVEGMDSAEVCNVLQISETNQRVLLHRARAKLRRALESYLSGATP